MSILSEFQPAAAGGALPFSLFGVAFRTPKRSETLADCQDACAIARTERGLRAAVADGATTSFLAQNWAQLLVDHYCEDPPTPGSLQSEAWERWLEPLRRSWRSWAEQRVADRGNPYYLANRLARGDPAGATLVGLELESADGSEASWTALILGDSCLFHLRNGRILRVIPLDDPAKFDHYPEAFVSDGPQRYTPTWFQGTARHGDVFVLATDALAKWLLMQLDLDDEMGGSAIRELLSLADEDEFTRVVEGARRMGSASSGAPLEDDDTTFLALSCGTSFPGMRMWAGGSATGKQPLSQMHVFTAPESHPEPDPPTGAATVVDQSPSVPAVPQQEFPPATPIPAPDTVLLHATNINEAAGDRQLRDRAVKPLPPRYRTRRVAALGVLIAFIFLGGVGVGRAIRTASGGNSASTPAVASADAVIPIIEPALGLGSEWRIAEIPGTGEFRTRAETDAPVLLELTGPRGTHPERWAQFRSIRPGWEEGLLRAWVAGRYDGTVISDSLDATTIRIKAGANVRIAPSTAGGLVIGKLASDATLRRLDAAQEGDNVWYAVELRGFLRDGLLPATPRLAGGGGRPASQMPTGVAAPQPARRRSRPPPGTAARDTPQPATPTPAVRDTSGRVAPPTPAQRDTARTGIPATPAARDSQPPAASPPT